MSADRRTFLRNLAALPLIGGSVALIGQPSAVAEPASYGCLEAYKTFLIRELRTLAWEMADLPHYREWIGGGRVEVAEELERIQVCGGYRTPPGFHHDDASDRAALVLSTVGVSWDEGRMSMVHA